MASGGSPQVFPAVTIERFSFTWSFIGPQIAPGKSIEEHDDELTRRDTRIVADERVRFRRASAKPERRLAPKAGQRRVPEIETGRAAESERERENVRRLDVRLDLR